MQRFFAAIIHILIAMLAVCMIALVVVAGWLLVLDDESRNRLVMEVGANPAWKEPKFILIQTGIPFVWLACVIVCFLKGKPGIALASMAAAIVDPIPIAGMYWHHIITQPLLWLPFIAAIRLGRPDSYWAYWFYRRNLHKYWRAVERFGFSGSYSCSERLVESPEC